MRDQQGNPRKRPGGSDRIFGILSTTSFPDNTLTEVRKGISTEDPEVDVVIGDSIVFEKIRQDIAQFAFRCTHPRDTRGSGEMMFGNPGIDGSFSGARCSGKSDDRQRLLHLRGSSLRDPDRVGRPVSVRLEKPTISYRAHVRHRTTNRAMSNILDISLELSRMASDMARSTRRDCDQRRLEFSRGMLSRWGAACCCKPATAISAARWPASFDAARWTRSGPFVSSTLCVCGNGSGNIIWADGIWICPPQSANNRSARSPNGLEPAPSGSSEPDLARRRRTGESAPTSGCALPARIFRER